jgi:hypothetical protein
MAKHKVHTMQVKLLYMILILLTVLLCMFGFVGQESSTNKSEPPEQAESMDSDQDRD